jgi:peptidoglycan-N-acetylglucosamine deacetylase
MILCAALVAALIIGAGVWAIVDSRSFQLAGIVVTRANTEDRVVALTFNDGPSAAYTREILSELIDLDVSATFFVTGREVDENSEMARMIVEAGHELGNHSYSHQRMLFQSTEWYRQEVERTDLAIRRAGYQGEIYFRPPYGKRLLGLPRYLARTGRTTVMWDLEPESYAELVDDAELMAAYVVDNAEPGSIVLLHLMYASRETSRQALPMIINGLRERGFELVTLSDLLSR